MVKIEVMFEIGNSITAWRKSGRGVRFDLESRTRNKGIHTALTQEITSKALSSVERENQFSPGPSWRKSQNEIQNDMHGDGTKINLICPAAIGFHNLLLIYLWEVEDLI